DVDGDARKDILAASRRELRLFRQRADGSFPARADRTLVPVPASEQDYIRGTGQFRVGAADLDGDAKADLIASRSSGGLMQAQAHASVHHNRDGWWDLEQPEQVLGETRGWGGDQLADLDGDGRLELLHLRIPMSAIELIEFLVTRSLDLEFTIHRGRPGGLFAPEPWIERKLQVPIDFETLRPAGFLPSFAADLNLDGYRDLVTSGRGDSIDVYLGGPDHRFRRRLRQPADTRGRLRIADFDGDGWSDLLIYEPTRADVPIRIARNRGALPGPSRPSVEAGESADVAP
ncbi:MAG: VCBS repeat-containing protein, partial [Deltaproteobacteria bacterium]